MRETETQQFSTMFQKLAMAVKSKTYELFTEDDNNNLLDSSEDFLPNQKVVVLKPDSKIPVNPKPNRQLDTQTGSSLISSLFATISSFEASYLQLQSAHSPLVQETVIASDKALVSCLHKLSNFKQFYRNYKQSFDFDDVLSVGSCLESRVQENQSKLRALGTVSNRLQCEMDAKDVEVWSVRKKLSEVEERNGKLSKRLLEVGSVVLSVRVYELMLFDCVKECKRFSKVLIELMEKAGWDLEVAVAASEVYGEVREGDCRYALLSYVCLGMFRGFDEGEVEGEGERLRELMQHVSSNPMELIERDGECGFARFCDKKYREVIHPSMFSNMDGGEAVLSSWRGLSRFYESFVTMASAVWTLHKLALSFDPVVEIFQVESGVDFSIVFMEDVVRRRNDKKLSVCPVRGKVGFTVVPGFKVGCTVIQSQVYLCK